jgi:hypothetical protein
VRRPDLRKNVHNGSQCEPPAPGSRWLTLAHGGGGGFRLGIKVDFLSHFHKPRLDILLWILVEKLAPTYQVKLDSLVSDGRHRHIASWRKAMKEEFNRCARAVL